ncbi:MFS transporter [Nocardioides marmorisolisilvae]|uniref:MFS transporter n=1 Tax=Nocardioides marmorisolisilvae TaxID=1542737 RepID=A0A3N0DUU6_9ACTN|nr:MFS transporter [Nocardioides marmorisolisilvae]RNL79397.1 MFS transporter [Nocardioides marmorisolisilvae]
MTDEADLLDVNSARGRWTLATVIIGSGIALLDGTVVNIAVRTIGDDLGAGLSQVQWVLNGYLLALASLILVGSSLGDRHGRKRVYLVGVGAFGVASIMCAFAQTPEQLIGFRVLQGIAGALLTPGALALIQASFRHEDRPAAIGRWAGVTGVAAAIGPFVGGFLVEHAGWRWIFAINIPLCIAVIVLSRHVPESRDEDERAPFDIVGAVLGTASLGLITYLLTSWRDLPGWLIAVGTLVALLAGTAFVLAERRPGAMAPVELFASRVFTAANLMTFLVYGALGAVLFLLVLQLQVTSGYSALQAGLATLPITIVMLTFSSRAAVLAARTGPRFPMSIGPMFCAAGVLLLSFIGRDAIYLVDVFPGMVLFAVGLTTLVSPLTTAVLAAAPDRHAGVASGINNAVARAGSLLAVAALPAVVGLSGEDYQRASVLTAGFRHGQWLCAALLIGGGLVSWYGLRATAETLEP